MCCNNNDWGKVFVRCFSSNTLSPHPSCFPSRITRALCSRSRPIGKPWNKSVNTKRQWRYCVVAHAVVSLLTLCVSLVILPTVSLSIALECYPPHFSPNMPHPPPPICASTPAPQVRRGGLIPTAQTQKPEKGYGVHGDTMNHI